MANLDLSGLDAPLTKAWVPTSSGGTLTVDPLRQAEIHLHVESGATATYAINGGDPVHLPGDQWVRVWESGSSGPSTSPAQTVVVTTSGASTAVGVRLVGRGR